MKSVNYQTTKYDIAVSGNLENEREKLISIINQITTTRNDDKLFGIISRISDRLVISLALVAAISYSKNPKFAASVGRAASRIIFDSSTLAANISSIPNLLENIREYASIKEEEKDISEFLSNDDNVLTFSYNNTDDTDHIIFENFGYVIPPDQISDEVETISDLVEEAWSNDHKVKVDDFSSKIETGHFYRIKGKKGAGKSEFIKSLFGLNIFSKGNISWPCSSDKVVLSNQNIKFSNNITLKELLSPTGKAEDLDINRANYYLTELGMTDILGKHPSNNDYVYWDNDEEVINWNTKASGGQKNTLAFIKILLKDPEIIFLDETLTGMGVADKCKMIMLLTQECPNSTVFFVDHQHLKNTDMEEISDENSNLKIPDSYLNHKIITIKDKTLEITDNNPQHHISSTEYDLIKNSFQKK